MASNPTSLQAIISQFMQTAQQSLLHVITSLQSDQLLQQMRNDQNLYQQKMNYINELIKQHFVLQPINELLVKEIQQLKNTKSQLQTRLQQSKQQYISQLSNIQLQYNQFLSQKQSERRAMENTIEQKSHEIFMLKKDFGIRVKELQVNGENLQRQLDINKKKLSDTKNELQQAVRLNEKLKKQLTSLKQLQHQHTQQTKSKNFQLSTQYTLFQQQNIQLKTQITQLSHSLKHSSQTQLSLYQTIERMKQDMFLIKQQWQKRCQQVQRQLTDDYRNKLIAQEEEMNQRLKLYVEELKMGKNVIIESSQEILQSKKQLIQERFNSEINRYQQDLKQLEQQLQEQKSKAKESLGQLKTITEKLSSKQAQLLQTKQKLQSQTKTYQSLLKSKQQQLQLKLSISKQQTQKQIDRLRKTQSMLLKDLKTSKSQKQQILKQVHSLKQQFSSYKQKQLKQAKRLKQLQQINQTSNMKILQLKKDLAIMGEKSSMDQRALKDRNNEISRLENSLSQVRHEYKDLDNAARRLELKISQLNLKVKQNQRIKAQLTHKVEKLYLSIRKLSKQLSLVKQDITFYLNSQKPHLHSIVFSITQQITTRQQSLKLSHKHKMRELLDDLDQERKQQRLQQQQLLTENENMKKEIRLLQQVMREKQEDYLYTKERAVNVEVEKCRVVMQEELMKERDQRRKLEEKIYHQEKRFQYNMTKAEKEVAKQINGFLAKWDNKITHTQQLLLVKDKALKELTNQLKKLTVQYQSTQHQLQQTHQKTTKYQQKYQSLKQQRDKTIDQMMKRLQKQTRHKLALQKQLKDIRGQIIKTQAHTTNSSSPFNNYSFTDRQNANVYTNAFQTTTQDKLKTHVKHTNREKELSEIREMIAKTYKVVETGAERDDAGYKGKLF